MPKNELYLERDTFYVWSHLDDDPHTVVEVMVSDPNAHNPHDFGALKIRRAVANISLKDAQLGDDVYWTATYGRIVHIPEEFFGRAYVDRLYALITKEVDRFLEIYQLFSLDGEKYTVE